MKAWQYEQFGEEEVMHIADVNKPTVSNGTEVLIKVKYVSVNPVDWKIREGDLKDMLPHEFPIIPGWDVSGIVESIGSDVTNIQVGDSVFAYGRKPVVTAGTYAEYVVLPFSSVAKIPDSTPMRDAAGLPLTSLTAYQALTDHLKIEPGQSLYITAGSGGVGSLAIQIAKYLGATVIATASPKNHDYLRELGADHVFDYQDPDLIEKIKKIFPNGTDAVLDAAGYQSLDGAWEVVKTGGKLVSIVAQPDQEIAQSKKVAATFHFVEPSGVQLESIGSLIDSGKIVLPHTEEQSIKQATAALAASKSGHTRGKVVLKVDF